MRHRFAKRVFTIYAALLLAACNLSNDQPGGLLTPPNAESTEPLTTLVPVTEDTTPSTAVPVTVPEIVLTPNATSGLPTRTPFGSGQPGGQTTNETAPTLSSAATALPTSATGESAAITSPAQGASIPPGTIQISGTVTNLPEDRFTLAIVAPDNNTLNSQEITLRNPNRVAQVPWSAAVQVTRYTGPAQIRVIARTPEREITLAAVDIVIGQGTGGGTAAPTSPPARPASSPTGSIDSPRSGETVTGDPVMITGTAGGFPGGTFTLELLAADGTVLGSIPITLTGSDTAAVPWSAPVSTGGYRGQVTIRTVVTVNGSPVELARTTVTLG